MMNQFLNRIVIVLILLMSMVSCFSSIEEEDCVGVYLHKNSLEKGVLHYVLINADGSFLHYCNDTTSNKYKYEGFCCYHMHNKDSNTYIGEWKFYPKYDYPLSVDGIDVEVFSTGFYRGPDVDDHFKRIDTVEAIDLGILPEECYRDLKLEPSQIIPEVQDYLQRLPDETYKAVYHKYSNYKTTKEREQEIKKLIQKQVDDALAQSYISLGYVIRKSVKNDWPSNKKTWGIILVGIKKGMFTAYYVKRNNEAYFDVFRKIEIGDTVIMKVSKKYPDVNRVINWLPSHEEIEKYK